MAIEISRALVLAEIIVRSAIQRKESRGHHYRSDFPESPPDTRHTLVKMRDGDVHVGYADVTRLG
jgi:succinate dehydrogenase/fumarate reductase flavoprotein subunit